MKIYRMQELAPLLGLGRATLYKMIAEGDFPAGFKLGERARGWTNTEVEEWIKSRQEVA